MKNSTTGLQNTLERDAPLAHALWVILDHKRRCGETPTPVELQVAQARLSFDQLPYDVRKTQDSLLNKSTLSQNALASEDSVCFSISALSLILLYFVHKGEPFDQTTFERLVSEWVAVSNQPFTEVEQVEFQRMMQYGSRLGPKLPIPSAETVKCRISEMASDNIAELKTMISVCHFNSSCHLLTQFLGA
jgi:hypothetical protein